MTRAGREDPRIAAGIEAFLKSVPAGRAGSTGEVAELVLFLLSAKSGYRVGTLMTATAAWTPNSADWTGPGRGHRRRDGRLPRVPGGHGRCRAPGGSAAA
ncbi:hypothetical protein ACIQFU_27390 [Streptomyces sp. NPDC093065]|uniref:hypothetical protein n=1 Tax=Streptomyces sp. NPDC093065 TaxID=3366021 RepID=UPI00381DEF10